MINAIVFVLYLLAMLLPLFIMWVMESYSVHVRSEKKHKRLLERLHYYTDKRFYED